MFSTTRSIGEILQTAEAGLVVHFEINDNTPEDKESSGDDNFYDEE